MERNCPFCNMFAEQNREISLTTRLFFAFTPLWPVNAGHTLIVPKRHIQEPFDLNDREMRDLRLALQKMREILDNKFNPDGYNIGINCGTVAGQTVFHLHLHIIPRFQNDVPDPRGGIIRQLLQDYKTTDRPPWLPEFPKQKSSP